MVTKATQREATTATLYALYAHIDTTDRTIHLHINALTLAYDELTSFQCV